MTKGLVRKNNLSDLESPEQARINLGLASADYNRIKGLYASAGVSNVEIQRIANAAGNYQFQIDSINSTINSIVPAAYANVSGDTISGTWTNVGRFGAVSVLVSGVSISGSSDSLFTHETAGGQFRLTTSTLVANKGLNVEKLIASGNTVVASGVIVGKRIPITINNVPFFLEAS